MVYWQRMPRNTSFSQILSKFKQICLDKSSQSQLIPPNFIRTSQNCNGEEIWISSKNLKKQKEAY